ETARLLVERGALGARSRRPPLLKAARSGKPELVALLLDHGADVNAQEDSYDKTTAPRAAAERGHTEDATPRPERRAAGRAAGGGGGGGGGGGRRVHADAAGGRERAPRDRGAPRGAGPRRCSRKRPRRGRGGARRRGGALARARDRP